LRHIRTYFAAFSLLFGLQAVAQNAWPVDSLLTTWPLQQRLQETRTKPKPGPVPDTDRLYDQLKRETPALPVFGDSLVDRFVKHFATERREHFRVVLGAAEAHLPMIERELARHGLPNELKYLPFALSAFNPQAHSNSGEAGLWMLTYPVALKHGLVVSEYIDERRDPEKCTVAAMRWLQDLHGRYGDWPTTVMAFSCGPANLTRALPRSGRDRDPRMLYPHFASGQRSVLPRLMAFTFLALNAEKSDLEPLVFRISEANDTVRFDSTLQINALTRVVGTRPARFRAINPTLTGGIVPAGQPFLLPRSEAQRFGDLAFVVLEAQSTRPRQPVAETRKEEEPIDKLPDGREATLYRITEGDCLNCIAERFGVKPEDIKTWNELADAPLELGNTLIIYLPRTERLRYESDTVRVAMPAPEAIRNKPKEPPTEDAEFVWYTVRSGDSLYVIAKKYPGVSPDDLMRHNGIGADIRPGQKIKIPKR
jgi:membrane-bound lytic murein transglycosylase D